jgi:hypothetical protein
VKLRLRRFANPWLILEYPYHMAPPEIVDPYLGIWGSSVPCLVKPARHCYHLMFVLCPTPADCPPSAPPREEGVVHEEVLVRRVRHAKVSIWRRSRCPGKPDDLRHPTRGATLLRRR